MPSVTEQKLKLLKSHRSGCHRSFIIEKNILNAALHHVRNVPIFHCLHRIRSSKYIWKTGSDKRSVSLPVSGDFAARTLALPPRHWLNVLFVEINEGRCTSPSHMLHWFSSPRRTLEGRLKFEGGLFWAIMWFFLLIAVFGVLNSSIALHSFYSFVALRAFFIMLPGWVLGILFAVELVQFNWVGFLLTRYIIEYY